MGITWITPVDVTPTTTSTWVDVDLSSHIPSGGGMALFRVVNTSKINYRFNCRQNGSTDNRTSVNNLQNVSHCGAFCGVDINGVCEIFSSANIDVYLVGYVDSSSSVPIANAIDVTPTNLNIWEDQQVGYPGAIGAFIEVSIGDSTNKIGLRKNGSTDDRNSQLDQGNGIWGIVGTDDDGVFEIFSGNNKGKFYSNFYLNGYLKSGVELYTNAVDQSLTTTRSYVDLPALPESGTGGFFHIVNTTTDATDWALRKKNDPDWYEGAWYTCYAFVEADENGIIEGKISNITVDFYLIGHSVAESPVMDIIPSGISTTEAFGTATSIAPGSAGVLSSGISSAESFGAAVLSPGSVKALPFGAPSQGSFGTAVITGTLTATPIGIPSQEVFGALAIIGPQWIALAGVPSHEGFGSPSMGIGASSLDAYGIASDEAFGYSIIKPEGTRLTVFGIASAEAFPALIVRFRWRDVDKPSASWNPVAASSETDWRDVDKPSASWNPVATVKGR